MSVILIESLYKDHLSIVAYLKDKNEISLGAIADSNLKKNLILSAASYFETKITYDLSDYFMRKSINAECVGEFLINKGLNRQYHTLFDWNASNANAFFALFGQDFKAFMIEKVKHSVDLSQSIKSFLELGRERNRLVHQNFGQYNVEKTLDEVYDLYKSSVLFVEALINNFQEYQMLLRSR